MSYPGYSSIFNHLYTVVNMTLYKHDYRSGEISKKRSRRFISNTLKHVL